MFYSQILNYLRNNPHASRRQFHAWARSIGMDPVVAESILFQSLHGGKRFPSRPKCTPRPDQTVPPYFGPIKPIACPTHDLAPVRMHRAPFGYPKGAENGQGVPPKGWCYPSNYAYPRM